MIKMTGTEMIIVAFNEADACDSKAFHTWDGFFSWVIQQVQENEDADWRARAEWVYKEFEDTDVIPFDTWLKHIDYDDAKMICSYFGYSAIEEIDVEE
jgi:hypothetical protein